MGEVVVRAAGVDDAAAMARVHVAAWRAAYDGLVRAEVLAGMSVERATTGWAAQLAAPPSGVRVVVGELDQEVVGFAVAGPSRDDEPPCEQELYAANVRPDAWGAGVGGALLDAVLEPGPCSLWVVVGNDRAIGFYERRGFLADGTTLENARLGVTEQRMVRD